MRLLLALRKEAKTVLDVLHRQNLNETVTVKGWIRDVQEFKNHFFCRIGDGLSPEMLQVVVERKILSSVDVGTAVVVKGTLVPSRGKQQAVELKCLAIETVGPMSLAEFPLNLRQNEDPNICRQHLHLRPKTSPFASFLRVRHQATMAIHNFFEKNNFVSIHTPVITRNDCEGAGEAFKLTVDKDESAPQVNVEIAGSQESSQFFGTSAFLTVSGQLHLEAAASAIKNVYTFGPTFRAEKSATRHHLAEFYMVEAEMAFVQNLDQLLKLSEQLIHHCVQQIRSNCSEDLQRCNKFYNEGATGDDFEKSLDSFVPSDQGYQRVTYDEAIDVLLKSGESFQFKPERGKDLQKAHEHYLLKHFGNVPLFITHFPSGIKPFYMKRNDTNNRVFNFDLLAPHSGEICGGSLRESNYAQLEERLKSQKLSETLQWYLELRKYGCPQLGGFGLGFDRFLQSLMGIHNIKDAIPFPRWYKHCWL